MSLKTLCFIYRFIDDPAHTGFRIIGVHDQYRPWTPQQLSANGLVTQKFATRSSMELAVESLAKKFQVNCYSLISIHEYNSLMEESHHLDDFRVKLQSREISLLGPKITGKEHEIHINSPKNAEKQLNQGFFSRFFNSES